MIKKDTIVAYQKGEIHPSEIANRLEKPLGTNCHSVQLASFIENWNVIRVIVKKSRLNAALLEKVRELKFYSETQHFSFHQNSWSGVA